jgi:GxxExxY protein
LSKDPLTGNVIGAAIEVHKALGPGLLESAYQKCMEYELKQRGLDVRREVALPVRFKDLELEYGYRIDLLINDELVVETKTVEAFTEVHEAQILTYMKFGNFSKGLLLNFKVKKLADGIKRMALSS